MGLLSKGGGLFQVLLAVSASMHVARAQVNWFEEKFYHKLGDVDAKTYDKLALGGTRVNFESVLDPLLIPRVPGTQNHANVKNYIIDFMKRVGWTVETDAFEEATPHGVKPFENIMATLNPDVSRRLVLACHYDSKYYREDNFVGATDSAVPCAMLLHMAEVMQDQLIAHKNSPAMNVSLQFIFFDGEEAWNYWTPQDSLYGSRHLATKWQAETYPPNNRDKTTTLNRMDVMVLLDLLGTSNIKLFSYFDETSHLHNSMVQTELQLKRSRYWSGTSQGSIFQARQNYGGTEDDHIPFLQRGVDIVHLIPLPFPSVWHTPNDNKDALDFPTIDNLNKIFRLFVARYLWGTAGPTRTGSTRPPFASSSSTAANSMGSSITQHGPLQSLFNLFNKLGQHIKGNQQYLSM